MSELYSDSPPLPPPFLTIPGISNIRDVGGYSTTTHHSIKRNFIYRSADPSKVSSSGLATLHSLGVATVFDLRSLPEIQRKGPEWEGVEPDIGVFVTKKDGQAGQEGEIERVWCPVFEGREYGPEQVAERFSNYAERNSSEGFVKAYREILKNGKSAYGTIFRYLAQEDPKPCIIHCTAGKDRTGVICALLYMLCSVPTDTIAEEYGLTDKGLEHLKPLFKKRLLMNPVFGADEEAVNRMIDAQPEKMRKTVEMIEEEFGGAEGYVRDVVGLSEVEVERLRRNLLSDEEAAN